jgi:hypothetical protein
MELASSVAWRHALRLTLKMEAVRSTETVVPTKLHGVTSRKTVIEWGTAPVHTLRSRTYVSKQIYKKMYGGNLILERPVT